MKQPAIYIMTNKSYGTLYVDVTSNLIQCVYQYRNDLLEGFTKTYGCKILVYYEMGASMEGAILREKQIKGGSRKQKLRLRESMNPLWKDLYDYICPSA